MLLHTFQHIKGITAKYEQDLWNAGITTWEALESQKGKLPRRFQCHDDACNSSLFRSSRDALEKEDVTFFAKHLSQKEYYRIALTFPEKTLFLDIETTGLSRYYNDITLIGWCLNGNYGVYIQGEEYGILRQVLSSAKIIITFNGSLFDLPFLRAKLPELLIPSCHIDLRFLSKQADLSGGQKAIERLLGIKRPARIAQMKGDAAVLLWYKYTWGDLSSLKQLITYNHADIEGMKIIFDHVVGRLNTNKQFPQEKQSVFKFSKRQSRIPWHKTNSSQSTGIHIVPYKGRPGSIITLHELMYLPELANLNIIGIDLTGSETRPSGWCLLKGDQAATKLLGSDSDILKETTDSQPHLVSIDSPLSMPRGRISVYDDDPGRNLYGIMRYCEKALKKRGVNVYPSLIPSMQNVTSRGMQLANQLRSMGIPVIESFPGAAQDIMGIPRKGVSKEFLAKGLEKFGIKGSLKEKTLTHDELDAITSAIVGFFFWSGKFEALGNADEDYLIIPDIKTDPVNWRNRKVIGLSGFRAAGKTTACNFLKSCGFMYVPLHQVQENLLQVRKTLPPFMDKQQIKEKAHVIKRTRWEYQHRIQNLPDKKNFVCDGLQSPKEHAYFVETFGPAFLHIHIHAPKEVRDKQYRIMEKNEAGEKKTGIHTAQSDMSKLSSLAHIRIQNQGTIGNLIMKINDVLSGKYIENIMRNL